MCGGFMNFNVKGFINGNIYVSFKPLRVVSALVSYNGRIIYAGNSNKAKRLVVLFNGRIIDLEGKTVIPGFVDSHVHLDSLGLSLNTLDLRGVDSISGLKERLRKYYEGHKDFTWIIGRGWDQELFIEKRWPNHWDLDEVISDKPVFLERICGHAAVVNTKALEVTGLLEKIPESAYFLKNENKTLTGVVVEDAVDFFRNRLVYNFDEKLKMLRDALFYAASLGVTMNGFVSCSPETFNILQILKMMEGLPARVRVYMNASALDSLLSLGIRRSFGDEYLQIMGIKLFTDGSLGARTAWLTEPYNDDSKTSGIPTIEEEELINLVRKAHDGGLQLAIHAIGDKAIDKVLNAYSHLGNNLAKYRHRIEHASVIRSDQIEKMSKLGVSAAVQPHFIMSDWWAVKRVGEKRAPWVYPFKSMVKSKINIGFSTDSPVEPLNPWETVYAAVTRGGKNVDLYKYTMKEKFSVSEALHYYTAGSAYLLFEDENTGTLQKGKYADFIVIDKDPLEVEIEELRSIKTLMTVVSGNAVFSQFSP
ncbi:MAG: amidohydrolase [Thermoprotei archaeon]